MSAILFLIIGIVIGAIIARKFTNPVTVTEQVEVPVLPEGLTTIDSEGLVTLVQDVLARKSWQVSTNGKMVLFVNPKTGEVDSLSLAGWRVVTKNYRKIGEPALASAMPEPEPPPIDYEYEPYVA